VDLVEKHPGRRREEGKVLLGSRAVGIFDNFGLDQVARRDIPLV